MVDITENEYKLIKTFRSRIGDLLGLLDEFGCRDESLIRWIRARDHNLNKAEEMIRKSEKWKKDNDIKNLLHWNPPPEYLIKFSYKICGYDTEDSPVAICRFGSWDVRTEVEAGNRDLYLKYLQWISVTFLEHMKNLMRAKNKFISQFNVIFDVDGFSIRQISSIPTCQVLMETVRQFEDNYPETLKAAYMININKFYGIAFNMIKPLLTMKTASKIHAYDRYSEKWKEIITSSQFNIEPKIFCYDDEVNVCNTKDEDFETVVIKPGDKFRYEIDVEVVGSILCWKFKTESHDIGFSIINSEKNSMNELEVGVVIPAYRVSSSNKIQRNSIKCESTGKYIIVFDNTYSRIRSKTLHFSVTIDHKD